MTPKKPPFLLPLALVFFLAALHLPAAACPSCAIALIDSPIEKHILQSFNSSMLLMMALPVLALFFFAVAFVRMRFGSLSAARAAVGKHLGDNPYFKKMKTSSFVGFGLAIVVIFTMAATNIVGAWIQSPPLQSSKTLPVYAKAPAFTLIDSDGKKFSAGQLAGKIWVADFIFTRCQDECPLLTSHMARLARTFAAYPNIQFVSITVDPRYDSPPILAAYAKRFGARAGVWHFLTGKPPYVVSLIEKGFHLPLVEDPRESLLPGKEPSIVHSMKFILYDAAGRARGYYDGNTLSDTTRLVHDISALERESRDQK